MNFHRGGDGKPRGFGFGGFSLQKKPEGRGGGTESQMEALGLGMRPGSAPQRGYGFNIGKRRVKSEEEYVCVIHVWAKKN